jgi:hypothetical protein
MNVYTTMWNHMIFYEFKIILFEFAWNYLNAHEFMWMYVNVCEFMWIYMEMCE